MIEDRRHLPGRRISDYPAPDEESVKQVQAETGMDYLQAYRHVQQREWLQKNIKDDFPLGKSSMNNV